MSRDALVPLVAALLAAERRIALLERRLYDARWIAPGEEPNDRDKEVAKQRVMETIGALATIADDIDDDL
jgi:hypothetical protein